MMATLVLTQEQRDLLFHAHELTVDYCKQKAVSDPDHTEFYQRRVEHMMASAAAVDEWPVGVPFGVDLNTLDRARGALATLGYAVATGTSKISRATIIALEAHLREPFEDVKTG